ncbi:MAG: sodium:solute symporter [Marinilabiliaceae bacterium]|nr:sodium:solute symporter [Marinilabiliaceae bacterium]
MNPSLIAFILLVYFLILIIISRLTGKKNDNQTFFLGNRKSPWYIVAIGMIGASLSGVTFISVPGWVESTGFTYMQMVFGYFIGYVLIANILLPLFYRLNLTSIYSYLENRFGIYGYKTGSILFMVSKIIGAAARLYLMASALQLTLFDSIGIPFGITATATVILIWLYTYRGGMKTIIWTDTIQAVLMIVSVCATLIIIIHQMDYSLNDAFSVLSSGRYSKLFEFNDWHSKQHFIKQVISGVFITLGMTGLDQDMMQKNLTCKNLKESQKNMYWYGFAFIPVNLLFLVLGAFLYIFAASKNLAIPSRADDLFPFIATTSGILPPFVGVMFILGLIAAAYSSADSALASLTTSFSIDILRIEKKEAKTAVKLRTITHLSFSVLFIVIIILFRELKLDTIISTIFVLAGYTYGPLLGLYIIGLFTRLTPRDKWIPFISIISPVLIGILDFNSNEWFGFSIGYEKLIYNATFVSIGLFFASVNTNKVTSKVK